MPRLKLNPLNNYPFATEITVRTTDLNYGGHLGNDKMISLIHEARVAFLAYHGFTEKDFGGAPLILGDIAAVYLGEAFAGDILRFEIAAGEPTRCGFRLFFRVIRLADEKPIALIENGMVCYNYQTHSIQPLPKTVKHIFKT
jgi:acyl-CoA thioesterase FadM